MSAPTQHVHKWVAKALPHEPSLKVCECGATMTDREYRDAPVAASGDEFECDPIDLGVPASSDAERELEMEREVLGTSVRQWAANEARSAASGRERVHPRPKFLRRFALAVGLVWIAASLVVSVLVHDHAPVWIVAGFPAPLWATLGAAYATDHHWRRDAR